MKVKLHSQLTQVKRVPVVRGVNYSPGRSMDESLGGKKCPTFALARMGVVTRRKRKREN